MAEQIKDGSGSSFLAKVNKSNQLETSAVISDIALERNESGDAYNLNTGIITITDAVETPLIYFKNNETEDFIIEAVALGMFNSTGGSSTANVFATFIRNPTTGTIISNANNVDINSNRNYGSSKTLSVDAFKGATGNTLTNGSDHILVRISAGSRSLIGINEVIPKGSTFAVKIKPPTSNTSMDMYVAIIGYLHD